MLDMLMVECFVRIVALKCCILHPSQRRCLSCDPLRPRSYDVFLIKESVECDCHLLESIYTRAPVGEVINFHISALIKIKLI